MKFASALSIVFSLLAVATGISASKRPDGGPDGIYIEIVNANGTTTMEYLGKPNSTVTHDFDKRAGVGPVCQSAAMSASDIQAAEDGLASFFGSGNAFYGSSISNYYGSAVAYGCNYGNGQTMDSGTFLGFMSALDSDCGNTHAGYYNHPDWKASYGRITSSSSFC